MRKVPLRIYSYKMLDCKRNNHVGCKVVHKPLQLFKDTENECWTTGSVCNCSCHVVELPKK